jgi:hypothetical protein
MVRREVMLANPYRHGDFPEDYDLWLRLLAQGLRFGSVPAPVLAVARSWCARIAHR